MSPHRASPATPTTTQRLQELSENLWWTWQGLDEALAASPLSAHWRRAGGNLSRFLKALSPAGLKTLNENPALSRTVAALHKRFLTETRARKTWSTGAAVPKDLHAAFFCAEFGLWHGLPIYSGGLGVLAGDFLKSASDLGVPVTGVGLWYGRGYFRQRIDSRGQVEHPEHLHPEHLPLTHPGGKPLFVPVPLGHKTASVRVRELAVGRVPLLLLDTDHAANPPALRRLSHTLYVGDRPSRLQQELVLGVGGYLALQATGREPTVIHLNEGHSGLVALALLQQAISRGLTWRQALAWLKPRLVFTTHTQEEAGHERYDLPLITPHLPPIAQTLGVPVETLLALGAPPGRGPQTQFCLSTLCLRLSGRANGVSQRHGVVARQHWQPLWPGKAVADVPIGHVTNGVHAPTWLPPLLQHQMDATHGPGWRTLPLTRQHFAQALKVDPATLWAWREAIRQTGMEKVAKHLLDDGGHLLNPQALTVGFARRFAAYKRAGLLFHDTKRLASLLNNPRRPMQVIFAGKAHPRDEQGKAVLRQVLHLSHEPAFKGKIFLLENYDLDLAKALLGGVDLWLNTPEWPREACGTSGMKAVLSGALNASILDGWWEEAWAAEGAHQPPVGFAVAPPTGHKTGGADAHDARALYTLLEKQIVPLFHDRDDQGVPRTWTASLKAAMIRLGPVYQSHRMVADYVRRYYLPAHRAVAKRGK